MLPSSIAHFHLSTSLSKRLVLFVYPLVEIRFVVGVWVAVVESWSEFWRRQGLVGLMSLMLLLANFTVTIDCHYYLPHSSFSHTPSPTLTSSTPLHSISLHVTLMLEVLSHITLLTCWLCLVMFLNLGFESWIVQLIQFPFYGALLVDPLSASWLWWYGPAPVIPILWVGLLRYGLKYHKMIISWLNH